MIMVLLRVFYLLDFHEDQKESKGKRITLPPRTSQSKYIDFDFDRSFTDILLSLMELFRLCSIRSLFSKISPFYVTGQLFENKLGIVINKKESLPCSRLIFI